MKPTRLLALIAIAFPTTSFGANITFSTVSATFDQGAPYDISKTIDGALDGFGWGVFNGQTVNQTAVFKASSAFSATEIGLGMPQLLGTNHLIQQFRVSYTTDVTPALGGNWTQISPAMFRAANGASLTNVGSNMLQLAGTPSGGASSYFLTTTGGFSNVTGFRLELFPVAGNLGAAANGNLVLTELQAWTDGSINRALAAPVTANGATWPGFPASYITDGTVGTLVHPDTGSQTNFSYTVDLQQDLNLSSLEVVNRADGCCPERLWNYRVQVLDALQSPVWSGDIRTTGTNANNSGVAGIDTITAAMGAGTFTGRYVRITNLSNEPYNPQISEFRAFGAPIPEPSVGVFACGAFLLALRRRR